VNRHGRRHLLDPLMLLAALVAVAAILLLVYGVWGWGVSLLLAAALVLVAHADLGRREEKLTFAAVRARVALLGRIMAVRSRGGMALFAARREFAELEAERARLFRDLGQALFEEDEVGMKSARQALEAVMQRIGEKEAEIAALVRETEERVQRVQAEAEADAANESGGDGGAA